VVRPLLSRSTPQGREYLSRWPEALNLETGLYRPLLCRVLPFAGALFARVGEGLVEGTVALLGEGLYFRQTRDVRPGLDEEFGSYQEKPRPYLGFRYSFAFSIVLVGIGLSLALVYVLVMGA